METNSLTYTEAFNAKTTRYVESKLCTLLHFLSFMEGGGCAFYVFPLLLVMFYCLSFCVYCHKETHNFIVLLYK